MIAGCYVLHLYCDVPNCNYRQNGVSWESLGAAFTADTLTQCIKEAKKDGWNIDRRNGTFRSAKHYCPDHARAKKRRDAERKSIGNSLL